MNRIVIITATTCTLIALTGCGNSSTEQSVQKESRTTIESGSPTWILTSAPDGAVSISEVKANAKEGDQIVIKGRIGGRKSPISADSPVFTIVDLQLPYCGQHDDDACGSPWDYCCETPSTIASNSVTVQIMSDNQIDPIAAGLKPLDEVVLIGTVGARPNEQVLTIQATGVYPTGG